MVWLPVQYEYSPTPYVFPLARRAFVRVLVQEVLEYNCQYYLQDAPHPLSLQIFVPTQQHRCIALYSGAVIKSISRYGWSRGQCFGHRLQSTTYNEGRIHKCWASGLSICTQARMMLMLISLHYVILYYWLISLVDINNSMAAMIYILSKTAFN